MKNQTGKGWLSKWLLAATGNKFLDNYYKTVYDCITAPGRAAKRLLGQ